MNSNHHTPQRGPSARCQAFAALLPLLDEPGIDADAAAEARAHLATCAACQAERATYQWLDAAARRYLSPPATPRYQTERLMSDLLRETPAALLETLPAAHARAASPLPALPRQPGRPRRLLSGLASFAAVLVLVLIAVSLFEARAHPQQTNVPASATPVPGSDSELQDVAMVSPDEGWAVGYTLPGPLSPKSTGETVLLMHYLHGVWSQVRTAIHGRLTSLSMLSATDGWAIGYQENGNITSDLFLHYDGHSWKQVLHTHPPTVGGIHQLQMLSDTDGWALSYSYDAFLWQYDGQQWHAHPLQNQSDYNTASGEQGWLEGISMTSPTNGWAVGTMQPAGTTAGFPASMGTPPANAAPTLPVSPPNGVILHYTGGQWTVVQTITGVELTSVVMTSPDEGWAVGQRDFVTASQEGLDNTPLLLHYLHGVWSEVPNPLSAADSQHLAFERVFLRSDQDGWIIIGTGVNFGKSATLRYDGSQWQVYRAPINGLHTSYAQIQSISMTSAREGWAVGRVASTKVRGITNPYGSTTPTVIPLLLHFQNNAWTVYNTD
jgi:hypothetical protein